MPLRFPVRSLALLASLAVAASAADQPQAPDPVRVRTVVLFSSGVGYFEHAGTVDGAATCELRVRTSQLNDLLKSLLLDDQDGGHPGAVEYPSLDPIAKTLASFQVDIGGNPSLGSLLGQLRGAEVTVVVADQSLTGTVLGVEPRTVALGDHGDRTIDTTILNLLSEGSVRQFRLDELRSLTFNDPKLQEELGKALAALSQARDQDKKTVVLHFDGNGHRHVRLAYVVETPVWKTSYRLVMPEAAAAGAAPNPGHLQGWAIVENQTDSDWQGVSLALVSGRPISFIEDLSQPLYVQRPVVVPELFASLMPQTYEGGMQEGAALAAAAPAPAGPVYGTPMAGARMLRSDRAATEADGASNMATTRSIQEAAHADTLGQLFSYTVPAVSLARQRSAMLPIIVKDIQTERVSVYNRGVLTSHPLNGAILTNTTGDLLLQGPVTVLDGSYAGDASLDNLSQGDHRLILLRHRPAGEGRQLDQGGRAPHRLGLDQPGRADAECAHGLPPDLPVPVQRCQGSRDRARARLPPGLDAGGHPGALRAHAPARPLEDPAARRQAHRLHRQRAAGTGAGHGHRRTG